MVEKQNWETPRLECMEVDKKTGAKNGAVGEYLSQYGQS